MTDPIPHGSGVGSFRIFVTWFAQDRRSRQLGASMKLKMCGHQIDFPEASTRMTARAIGAAIFVGVASPALAVDASAYWEATQATIYISGSQRPDQSLMRLMQLNSVSSGLCADNTNDTYLSADGQKSLILCIGRIGGTNPIPPGLQGTRIAIHKTAQPGGSSMGVVPLVRTSQMPSFWQVPTGGGFLTSCAGSLAVPPVGSTAFSTYVLHVDCGSTPVQQRTPDVGISDLEPAMFANTVASGQLPLSSAELNAIPPNAISAAVFGIPVTLRARDNMQRVQFPIGNPCHPDSGAIYDAADETEACMPSLTGAQVAALFSQNYVSWESIVGGPSARSVASPDSSGNFDLADSGEVFVCRHHSSTGIQAIFETQILAQRCSLGVPGFATQSSDPVHVSEVTGQDNLPMQACMSSHNSAGRGAIGMMSMNFNQSTTRGGADDGFRIIKIDGAAPCLLPISLGKYSLIAESTMQWRITTVNGLAPLSGIQRDLALAVRNRMSNHNVLRQINSVFVQPACSAQGKGAWLGNALSNPFAIPTPPFVVGGNGPGDITALPILTRTRAVAGIRACAPLIDLWPTPLN